MGRKVSVKKSELLEKIKANREQHIIDFEQALIDYKVEALKQLKELTKKVTNGETRLYLSLVTPVNKKVEYDKLITMFEMETADIVELEQYEFNQYVFDETDFAKEAKFANMTYFSNK